MNAAFGSWLGVPKASASPNIATLVALFMLTPDGQKFYFKYNQKDSHLREGTVMNRTFQRRVFGDTGLRRGRPTGLQGCLREDPKTYSTGAGK